MTTAEPPKNLDPHPHNPHTLNQKAAPEGGLEDGARYRI